MKRAREAEVEAASRNFSVGLKKYQKSIKKVLTMPQRYVILYSSQGDDKIHATEDIEMKKTPIKWFADHKSACAWVKKNGMPHLHYSIDRCFGGYMVGAY